MNPMKETDREIAAEGENPVQGDVPGASALEKFLGGCIVAAGCFCVFACIYGIIMMATSRNKIRSGPVFMSGVVGVAIIRYGVTVSRSGFKKAKKGSGQQSEQEN